MKSPAAPRIPQIRNKLPTALQIILIFCRPPVDKESINICVGIILRFKPVNESIEKKRCLRKPPSIQKLFYVPVNQFSFSSDLSMILPESTKTLMIRDLPGHPARTRFTALSSCCRWFTVFDAVVVYVAVEAANVLNVFFRWYRFFHNHAPKSNTQIIHVF